MAMDRATEPLPDHPPPTSSSDSQRAAELRQMQRIATALLGLAALLFAFTLWGIDRWPWLAPIQAFAEAALVGGIADWFAVTALFRHPLGLPIPHTAVIPQNHARIAGALGRFVAGNLLASEAMAHRLEEMDSAGRLGRWLLQPLVAATIARRIAAGLPPVVRTIGEQSWRDAVGKGMRRAVDVIITAPRMSSVLAFMVGHGYHHAMLDTVLGKARGFLRSKRSFIRAKVAQRCPEWLPLWIEEQISQGVTRGLDESLIDLEAHDHPWRQELEVSAAGIVSDLAGSAEFSARLDEIKAQIFDDPAVSGYLRDMAAETYAGLAGGGANIETLLEHSLRDLGHRLEEDPAMRQALNKWLRRAVEELLVPRRDAIGQLIADLIMRWNKDTLIARFEGQVGKDLQYIRINGTLVGGLVGLAIWGLHRLSTLLP